MKMVRLLIPVVIIAFNLMFTPVVRSQPAQPDTASYPYWIEMMQDEHANYFETVKAFNKYFENRPIQKGCGWKPFKRWEYFWRTRVDENGKKPAPYKNWTEYQKFISLKGKATYGAWQLIGPINRPSGTGLGRVNAIAFHPTDPKIIYAGSPSGGLWITTDGGSTWKSLTYDIPTLGVSAIAIDPVNPNIIYIGTGDDDAGDAPGYGILKSTDGGTTWQMANQGIENETISKILIFNNNPQQLLTATLSGVYKSVNGGESWVYKGGGKFTDIVFKPYNENVVYGTANGSFYKSANAGETWKRITTGILAGSRSVVAVTPANPEIVYVTTTNSETFKAFYASVNSGESFTQKSNSPNIMGYQATGSDDSGQAWYDLCMATSPTDANTVYVGGINIFKSTNGGTTWQCAGHWIGQGAPFIHADQHIFSYSPLNGRLYIGNDGGFYVQATALNNWVDLSDGLSITQIYKLGQSATIKNLVITGYQDNGTAVYNNGTWTEVIGGDGMECQIDYSDANYRYGELYYGEIRRTTTGGSSFSAIAGNGINGINETGGWVTPFMLHRTNPLKMYVGYKNVWKTDNVRYPVVSWTKITTANTNPSNALVNAMEQSPVNPEIFYYAREDNKLFRTENLSANPPTWVSLNNAPKVYINDIEAHPYNENIVYIVNTNHRIYKSENKGTNWVKISDGLPEVGMNCLAYDKLSDEGIYVGTDIGVFYKDNSMSEWVLFSDGMPASTIVTEIEIFYNPTNPEENRLRASTYGRGLWESPLYSRPLQPSTDAETVNIIFPSNIQAWQPFTGQLVVKNFGQQPITQIDGTISINGGNAKSFTWAGTINSFKSATISLAGMYGICGTNHVKICILQVNQANETNMANNVISGSFSASEAQLVKIDLTTDNLGSETTWELKNSNNQVLLSGGPYEDGTINHITDSISLTSGCYTFYIYDAGNNGICCASGNGSYTLTNLSTTQQLANGSTFAAEASHQVCISFTAIPVIDFSASLNSVCSGADVVFTQSCTGSINAYTWYFGNDATPSTATGAGPHTVAFSTGGYKDISLLVNTADGNFTLVKNAFVQVKGVPIITMQPADITLCSDDKLRLFVEAYGTGLSYQWKKDDVVISGATTPTFEILNTTSQDAGAYICVVSNTCQSVNSNAVSVIIKPLPALDISATATEICSGQNSTLTATGANSYLWSNGLGTNSAVNVTPTATTTYFVTGTTNGCSVQKQITVSLATMPSIQTQPVNQSICLGQQVEIFTLAAGQYIHYQWKKDGNILDGQTNPLLILQNADESTAGNYTCQVSSACGTVTSNTAVITLLPEPVAAFSYTINDRVVTFNSEAQNATSVYWMFGDGIASAATNPTHTYAATGEYEVKMIAYNGCGSDTTVQNIIILSVNDPDRRNIPVSIIPNPNSGEFMVIINDQYQKLSELKIVNITGQKIYNRNINPVFERNFSITITAPGLYQLILIDDNQIYKFPIMVY